MKKYQQEYITPYQLKFPIEIEKIIETTDPVYTFCEVIDHIDLNKYLTTEERRTGRPRYDEKTLLKVILFAFMENGYESLRKIEKLCKTDIRFMWLLQDEPPPSHMTIDNFMNNVLNGKIEEIFADINAYIFEQENVDMDHVYIDGTKIVANANKYSWVWKKSCEKNRMKVFAKITELLSEINTRIAAFGVKFGVREEYAIEYLEQILKQYIQLCGFDPASAVRGRGHHKTPEQRYYDKLTSYIARLKKYAEHIKICGKCKGNRIVRINEELTAFHKEVLNNLNCIHGALLRMNRSIQSEGANGIIKWNRSYTRARRRGLNAMNLEIAMICCGFNLHKFHLKKIAIRKAA